MGYSWVTALRAVGCPEGEAREQHAPCFGIACSCTCNAARRAVMRVVETPPVALSVHLQSGPDGTLHPIPLAHHDPTTRPARPLPPSNPPPPRRVSFQLLLVTPEDVMPPGTDHYRAVVGVAARTLGAISRRVSLAHVVDPFLKWVGVCACV